MARRNIKAWSVPTISGGRLTTMVSELDADKTDGVGDDPEGDKALVLDPKNSLETGRRIE